MRVVCVAGARPNFIKITPVLSELEKRGFDAILVHTGQHYDAALSSSFFEDLGLREPDLRLEIGSGSHAAQTARVMTEFEPVLEDLKPDAVVVVGDVNSTMGCAIVTAKAGPLLAHVEAGLRSRDWTMPEEINRVITDRVSDLLLAPSSDAVENLQAEGYRDDQIHLVGNVMIDTLLEHVERANSRPVLETLGVAAKSYGLVTLHRPANVDDPHVLAGLLEALGELSREIRLIFPVHPRARAAVERIGVSPTISIVEPLSYLDFLSAQANARLVLTDSGGVQEETTVLGVACLTLRENTERPITITEGTNTLVGHDRALILTEARRVLKDGVVGQRPALWDGHASERVVDVLEKAICDEVRLRPTDKARMMEPNR